MTTFLIIGLVLSIIGMFTTKQVASFIGPKGKGGPGDFIRTFLSIGWFTLGGLFCTIFALIFGLGLAIIH